MKKDLLARLQALKDHVWTAKNTGVKELKDALTELVDIVHKAASSEGPEDTSGAPKSTVIPPRQ
jgi:hypothetical protein